jgi:adenylosuccinate lyase
MNPMIERYSLSPMKELWSLQAQYDRWLQVELAALHAMEKLELSASIFPAFARLRKRSGTTSLLSSARLRSRPGKLGGSSIRASLPQM